jgi:exosortase H (IPTLxxWG-CTERM-specific)
MVLPEPVQAAPPRAPALRFLGIFAVLATAGIAALLAVPVDEGIVQPFNQFLALASSTAINLCGGHAATYGMMLALADGGGVEIANGCNAVEASILLAAAILAFPAAPAARIFGAAAGIASLQLLNLVRIVSLLYLSRYAPGWFDFFHLYLWDGVIMLDGLLIFMVWQRWSGGARQTA